LAEIRFLVDVNVAKLASLLRMAGFDTAYENRRSDAELAELSEREGRILLTRDRSLLKRRQVEFGHLVRSVAPREQLAEIITLYGLQQKGQPFSRCLVCNGRLSTVKKEEVLHRSERAVGQVLIQRHPPAEGSSAQNS